MQIPILRLGQAYYSHDQVQLGGPGSPITHTANPGLIRRDLLRIHEAKAALDAISAETLADYCEQAAEHFIHAELPCGDSTQSPQQYIESLSSLTHLPHSLVRMNMNKIHASMSQIRKVIAGLTRGIPLEIFDRGVCSRQDLDLNFFPTTSSLGVSLPSNAPAVNSLWIPALTMKIPVLLKPGREDPFTPLRIIHAMIQAGFPAAAFSYYPTTHEGGDTLLTSCGCGISFGSDSTVKKYSAFPTIQIHGTGRSKILIGEDCIERWPEFLDIIVQSISANGGRSCINTSAILVPSHRDELSDAIAAELAKITPLSAEHPDALLCSFANPKHAGDIDDLINRQLIPPGATDLTALHRKGPRKVHAFGQCFLSPTLVCCDTTDHPLANTEFMFPFSSICEIPQHQMLDQIGETLVVSAITEDPDWTRQLMLSRNIERLNLGPYPTNHIQWEQPHEGNLFDLLYQRRAIQGNLHP